MTQSILTDQSQGVGTIILNRPEVLNAWNAPMRAALIAAFKKFEADPDIRAVILTGAGKRAFGAGQDFNEAKSFDPDRAEKWVGEWKELYDQMRSLSIPIVAALNGVAAGSAFQVALLCDLRVGHSGVRMGQPEINAGIPSTTGPWIMREILGLARTIDLTLTGRMMGADECVEVGLISRLVPEEDVMRESMTLAQELAKKPPVAMRLNRARFREMTEAGFRDCLKAGIDAQREGYASGEPAQMMAKFFADRARKKTER